jgi:hypothetical protein
MLANVEDNGKEEDEGQLVSRMGRLDFNPLTVASNFVETARKVIRASEKQASMWETQFKGVDPHAQAVEIKALFLTLRKTLDSFSTEGDSP